MSILSAFDDAVADTAVRELASDLLLPVVLARACVAVLPIDGASLSLTSGLLRLPLGASDQASAKAEALQFTQGDGPCLDVYRSQSPTRATAADMRQRWPVYLQALLADTPYRAVGSVPFLAVGRLVGALDVYSRDESGIDSDTLHDTVLVAERIVAMLTADLRAPSSDGFEVTIREPEWLQDPAVGQRSLSWIAIGIVRATNSLDAVDALDLIRAYAWSHSVSVDEVTSRLVSRELSVEGLMQS